MSRRGSRTSRRSICTIRKAPAPPRGPRPIARRGASTWARWTACRSPSRTTSPPRTSRCRSAPPASCGAVAEEGCAAGRAAARSRRGNLRQDHDAGLRHAVVGPLKIPSPHPQSLGREQEPRRLLLRRGRGRCRRYGPLHLGTDIGGSVRLPACWSGLVALKPSFGRVPVDPPYVGRVAGPMTRIVDDAALMMCVLSAPTAATASTCPRINIHWKALEKSPRKLRIGLMLDPGAGQKLERKYGGRGQGGQSVRIRRRRRHRGRWHLDPRNARRAR